MAISRLERNNLLKGLAFISPWIVGFCVFTLLPISLSLYYSFCNFTLLQGPLYRGTENYQTINADPVFWKSLRVTAYFAIVALPMGMIIALSVAMLLNVKIRGMAIYRTIVYLPSLVPAVASAMLWLWLYNPKLGLINTVLSKLGVTNLPGWVADPDWAMPALVLMSFWGVGNTVIIYLAGLQDVPRELYEAAELDGAGTWAKIRHVTLPFISPVIFFNLIIAIIGSVQSYTTPAIMTPGGGPDRAAYFYTMRLYDQAFVFLKMGEASAMAWVQLFIVLALTGIAFWSSKKWVHYQGK